MRQTNFTILKALAIICIVIGHAGSTGLLGNALYLFHVPAFFLCAGYFFNTGYLTDERTFLVHRVKGLYWPFLKWSVFFLVFHNLFFHIGLLSETFGNVGGGVTHPYTWHQWAQHLWNIVFVMSEYDDFLAGTFWFFRALFVGSIFFLILFKIFQRFEPLRDERRTAAAVLVTAFLLCLWRVDEGVKICAFPGGGYRELMAVVFMATGFLLNRYNITRWLTWKIALGALAVVILFAIFLPTSMAAAPSMRQFLALPVPAVCGFGVLLYCATWLDGRVNIIRRALIYIGDRTLYIFAFHFLAFKLVSALAVAFYDLPWQAVGCHPTVHAARGNVLWLLLYTLVGVSLPLLWLWGWKRLTERIHFSEKQALAIAGKGAVLLGRYTLRLARIIARLCVAFCRSIARTVKEIIDMSSPKEE